MSVGYSELYYKAIALGFTRDGGGGGTITPAQAVALINAGLGQEFWQQGIANAIFVNDWTEDSPDLAPYLNAGTGEWDIPDGSFVVSNTDLQTLESILERTINALGDLWILPSVGGGVKGISMTAGIGEPEMTCMIKHKSTGLLRIGEVTLFSDDPTRDAFDTENGNQLFWDGTAVGLLRPGVLDFRTSEITGLDMLVTNFSSYVFGSNSQFITMDGLNFPGGFVTNLVDVFDLRIPSPFGPREISVRTSVGEFNAGIAGFLIDQDNGDNLISFDDCRLNEASAGPWIRAENDPAFNASPDKSVYMNFDVKNFAITQRLADIYLSDDEVTTFPDSEDPQDIVGNFVLNLDTSGFTMPSPGVVQYELEEDLTYIVSVTVTGFKITGGERSYQISPHFKPNGGVFNQVTKTNGVDTIPVEDSVTATPNDFRSMSYTFSQRFTQPGDQLKNMIEILANTDSWTTTKVTWTITKVG